MTDTITSANVSLVEKMLEAQIELHQTKLKKSGENPFHHSKFVTLATLMETVIPVLNKHKLLLVQSPTTTNDGQPALTTSIYGNGDVLSCTMQLMLKGEDPQAQGSAITYARRYSIMSLLGLVGDDDDDGHAATYPATKTVTKPAKAVSDNRPASDAQKQLIMSNFKRKAIDQELAKSIIEKKFNLGSAEEINITQAKELIDDQFKNAIDYSEYIK